MLSIAICIVTFRRNSQLADLLRSVANLELDEASARRVGVVVVDNDPRLSASFMEAEWRPRLPMQLHWVAGGHQRIALGRNAALQACGDRYDVIAFVDDDETLDPGWLAGIKAAFARHPQAAVVAGPVVPVFPANSSALLQKSGIYHRPGDPGRKRLLTASTANVAIRARTLHNEELEFDDRLSELGGEDYMLFRTLTMRGYRIAWSNRMVVYDHIPKSRMNLRWISRRAVRQGNTMAVADSLLYGRRPTALRRIPRSLVRLQLGGFSLIKNAFMTGNPLPGVTEMLTAAGTLAGLCGYRMMEYRVE